MKQENGNSFLDEQTASALIFYAAQESQALWRTNFMQRSSAFLVDRIKPISSEAVYASEERITTFLDSLRGRNPIWRTPTLQFGSGNKKGDLEMMGTALGTKSTSPEEVRINFKGPYGRTFTLYLVENNKAEDWSGQPMNEEQQKMADKILEAFETQHTE